MIEFKGPPFRNIEKLTLNMTRSVNFFKGALGDFWKLILVTGAAVVKHWFEVIHKISKGY